MGGFFYFSIYYCSFAKKNSYEYPEICRYRYWLQWGSITDCQHIRRRRQDTYFLQREPCEGADSLGCRCLRTRAYKC